jgi:Tfp pilus assembly protein PilX
MSRRLQLSAEHGFTMAAVMLVLLATTILAGASFAAVSTDIPFARESQDRKQAYAAAEAGIEYYLYQLTRDNDYWS